MAVEEQQFGVFVNNYVCTPDAGDSIDSTMGTRGNHGGRVWRRGSTTTDAPRIYSMMKPSDCTGASYSISRRRSGCDAEGGK